MNVFLVGRFNWFGNWAKNCEKALKSLGHNVFLFDYRSLETAPPPSLIKPSFPLYMNQELVNSVFNFKPDLILILKGETIFPETLAKIKELLDVPIATWWLDDPLFEWREDLPVVRGNIIQALSYFDYFFVFDSYHIPRLKRLGTRNAYWLPTASFDDYHPLTLSDDELSYYESDVSFVGTAYRCRGRILIELTNFNLKLWGGKWINTKLSKITAKEDILHPWEAAKVYNATKINLTLCHHQSVFGPNLRTFEILASGGFLITENLTDLYKLFKVGEEIVCYENIDDLKDKIEYYLAHPNERNAITEAGYKKVIENHTYFHRMQKILDIVLGKINA